MTPREAERLTSYLKLIMPKRDPERVRDVAAKAAVSGGLESFGGAADLVQQAQAGTETLLRGGDVRPEQLPGLEAIILPDLRPAVDVIGGTFTVTHSLWTHLSSDPAIRRHLEAAIPSIGRIELPGHRQYPYGGTGFVVGDGLVMTNRHVASIFATGVGSRRLTFKADHRAAVDFLRERNGETSRPLEVRRVVMVHPYWDMAILAVDGLDRGAAPLKLSLMDISELDGHEIAVVGYPAFDPRNDASEQDALFDRAYGVKRLQPGQLHRRAETESFGKLVSAAAHDCSTLGGNSGSAVLDLATGEVVALHFGGRYRERNFAVPAFELGRDGRVVDAGVTFAGRPVGGTPPWENWWELDEAPADGADGGGVSAPDAQSRRANASPPASPARRVSADGAVTIEIPLQITVRLGGAALPTGVAAPTVEAAASGEMLEALVEPWRDENYRSRRGYEPDFLGVAVPMPESAEPALLARTRSGGTVLHYQNFSIMMHAARRLALITASNVTVEKKLRRPDPRKKYTRAALSGLGENDQERWFLDPRLDEAFQLPDVFFTKDRKAFDKGHVIRRDDVAWGQTYELLRRANGDTYHVTNCSPQTAGFNRSNAGEDNWGDLENHVLSSASKERLALFAGPVLDPADTVFVGVGDRGRQIRAKIPTRYWKVVVAPVQDGIAAFGFVLEQDLSEVEFEYVPPPEFVPHMYPLADIQEMAGVRFPAVVLGADQYETVRGAEVSINAGARRQRRPRHPAR